MTTTDTLMARIEQHFMEHRAVMHLHDPADIAVAAVMKDRGLIDAAISPKSKSKDHYGRIELAIVQGITSHGRVMLANRHASGL